MSNIDDERMAILNMVNENKITTEEGAQMLNETNTSGIEDVKKAVTSDMNNISKNVEAFANNVTKKVKDGYTKIEPDLEKAKSTVEEKSAAILGDVSKTLDEASKKLSEKDDTTNAPKKG